MHPAYIKAAMEVNHVSQADIAKAAKVSSSSVHLVIHGRSRSSRIEKLISRAINIPLHDLWPKHYKGEQHAA